MQAEGELDRSLGSVALTLYGVGVIVGAGIFVLIGEVVATAGSAGWFSFLGAAIVAVPTALSYSELASRYPRSAGEAVFADRAFGRPSLSFLVGFLVVASGLMSTAAVSHGFAQYLESFVGAPLPRAWVIVGFLAVVSLVNDRGIRHAAWLNGVCTLASVGALLVVIAVGIPRLTSDTIFVDTIGAVGEMPALALLGGVALAFYAFIGFEDICNVAEETIDPSRTIPRAILWSLGIGTGLYVLVALVAVAVVDAETLATTEAPLGLVAQRLMPAFSGRWLAAVAMLAVLNTALLNLVMASRVVFGMARNRWLPQVLGRVHPTTRTPRWAGLLAFAIATTLAVTGALAALAEATNVIILAAFSAVNLSLIVLRRRGVPPDPAAGNLFVVPLWVPLVGLVLDVVLLVQLPGAAFLRAGLLVAFGAILHLAVLARSRHRAV